jgi:DNA-binding transcriptional ArsR family regulator
MARAATTSDPFNAVAEPRRRAILTCLARQERSVSEIVACLQLAQPSVSKHLRVLESVGLVKARPRGRCVFYRANPAALQALHQWTASFEHLWQHQLDCIKALAEKNQLEKDQPKEKP